MPIITRPLKPDDTGQAVADLHQALVQYGAPIADGVGMKLWGRESFYASQRCSHHQI